MKANMSLLANTSAFTGIGDPPTVVPTGEPTKLAPEKKNKLLKIIPEGDAELDEFANWLGKGADTKAYAADLGRRGLKNATDMFLDPQTSTPVKNNLSVWKPALIQKILMNAKARGYTTQQLLLDRENILKLSKGSEMINHPLFTKDKENFWNVVGNLYNEKSTAKKPKPAAMTTLAKK